MTPKQIHELSEKAFSNKLRLNTLHQEIAENFYPERADFTVRRELGDEFAEHLMTSYPVLVRRELANQIGTMLRPTVKPWFKMVPSDPTLDNRESKEWLEWAANLMRRAMYDPATCFTQAMKEADHDFATFGQPVIEMQIVWDNPNEIGPHLLYRTWHLRDVAWSCDRYGKVGNRYRRWRPTVYDLAKTFPGKLHRNLAQKVATTPLYECEVMHMVVEADYYDQKNPAKQPWWSCFWDCQNQVVIDEQPLWYPRYAIPRWQTIGSSPYAYSPATIVALPDARLLQAMTLTLLEAGEMATKPPMIAVEDVIRGDVALFSGGITIVDRDYDERLGEALRPLNIDAKGVPIGVEQQRDARLLLFECFFLNKLKLPQRTPQMTAYEVSQLVQQYIRDALPLFEPMEDSYNGDVCNMTFGVLKQAGAFGGPEMMPQILRGKDVQFRFQSPLHDEIEAQKGQKFLEMKNLVLEAMALDKNVVALPDAAVALRDALMAIGVPAKWQRSEITVREMVAAQQSLDQAQKAIEAMGPAAEAAANLATAGKDAAQTQSLAR